MEWFKARVDDACSFVANLERTSPGLAFRYPKSDISAVRQSDRKSWESYRIQSATDTGIVNEVNGIKSTS